MNVPLFVPTPKLLLFWHRRYSLLKERTWAGVHGRPRKSPVPKLCGNPSFLDERREAAIQR